MDRGPRPGTIASTRSITKANDMISNGITSTIHMILWYPNSAEGNPRTLKVPLP